MKPIFKIILLIINIIIWCLLAITALSPLMPPSLFLPCAFLSLAYAWIWGATALVTLLLLFFKPKFSLIGWLIVVVAAPFGMKHYAFSEDKSLNNNNLKVASYNVLGFYGQGQERLKRTVVVDSVAAMMRNMDADIICFQEFSLYLKSADAFMKKFGKSVGADYFCFYEYFKQPSLNKWSRGLFFASKFPVIQHFAIENNDRCIGMAADITVANDTIRVFNLHLKTTQVNLDDIAFVNNILNKTNRKKRSIGLYKKMGDSFMEREQEAKIVRQKIQQSPYPVIVCGDFNDTPASYAYRQISKQLTDSFLESGNGFGRTYNGDLPLMRIDYILHDNHFQTADFQVHSFNLSDHYPVSVQCSFLK